MIIFDLELGPVVFTFLFLRNLKSELTSLASHSSRVRREQRRHLQPGLVGLWAGDTRSWWQTCRRCLTMIGMESGGTCSPGLVGLWAGDTRSCCRHVGDV